MKLRDQRPPLVVDTPTQIPSGFRILPAGWNSLLSRRYGLGGEDIGGSPGVLLTVEMIESYL